MENTKHKFLLEFAGFEGGEKSIEEIQKIASAHGGSAYKVGTYLRQPVKRIYRIELPAPTGVALKAIQALGFSPRTNLYVPRV